MKDFINFINSNCLGSYKENVSFKALTTYRTGGSAKLLFLPKNYESLKDAIDYLKKNNIKYKIFGNGSNILASDDTYEGVIIKLSNLNNMVINGDVLEVESGYNFSLLCNKMSKEGYTGFEFGCGIPGSVGGSVYMNAGAYLHSISDVILKVLVLDKDLNIKELDKSLLDFSYRHSIFQNSNYIILKAYFKLEKGNKKEIRDLISERKERRKNTQPLEYPSAGSVFRNPQDKYAGKLIEDCGLKGKIYGGAMISDKHANFIINKENATSEDILYLMNLVQRKVKENYNIDLYREQELFNFGD